MLLSLKLAASDPKLYYPRLFAEFQNCSHIFACLWFLDLFFDLLIDPKHLPWKWVKRKRVYVRFEGSFFIYVLIWNHSYAWVVVLLYEIDSEFILVRVYHSGVQDYHAVVISDPIVTNCVLRNCEQIQILVFNRDQGASRLCDLFLELVNLLFISECYFSLSVYVYLIFGLSLFVQKL